MKKIVISFVILFSILLVVGFTTNKGSYKPGTYYGYDIDISNKFENEARATVYIDDKGIIKSVSLDTTYPISHLMDNTTWYEYLEKIENDVNSSTSFIDRVSKILYESLLFRKNSDLIKTIIKEISKNNTAECISFLKFYDGEIVSYIEEKIKQEIQNKTIKKCDAHLTAFIIYKVYSSILFEYDREIDEEKVTKEVTNILKDGLLN